MVKLKVRIGYFDFVFDDPKTAVEFALTAKKFNVEDSLHVSIDFTEVEASEINYDEMPLA